MNILLHSPILLGTRFGWVYEFPNNPALSQNVDYVVAVALGSLVTIVAIELWRRSKRRHP